MLLRGAVVVVALLALAWLGVLYRDRRVGQDAADVVFYQPGLGQAEWERQMERMQDARLLDPDRYWDLTRARYFLLRDRPHEALRTAEDLVSDEPANIDAWIVVYKAGRQLDPRRARQALAEIRRLDPLIAPARD
jgi:predicted Zn-dependent protease